MQERQLQQQAVLSQNEINARKDIANIQGQNMLAKMDALSKGWQDRAAAQEQGRLKQIFSTVIPQNEGESDDAYIRRAQREAPQKSAAIIQENLNDLKKADDYRQKMYQKDA